MKKNRLLENLRREVGSNIPMRRYSLADMISESYRIIYDCEDGSNLKSLAESHLRDIKESPKDVERLSRQLCIIKELVKMTESGELKDEDLVDKKAYDTVKPKKDRVIQTECNESAGDISWFTDDHEPDIHWAEGEYRGALIEDHEDGYLAVLGENDYIGKKFDTFEEAEAYIIQHYSMYESKKMRESRAPRRSRRRKPMNESFGTRVADWYDEQYDKVMAADREYGSQYSTIGTEAPKSDFLRKIETIDDLLEKYDTPENNGDIDKMVDSMSDEDKATISRITGIRESRKRRPMNESVGAVGAKVGDTIVDTKTGKEGKVQKLGQSGNYGLIYVDFGNGLRKINPMDDAQRFGRYTLKKGSVNESEDADLTDEELEELSKHLETIRKERKSAPKTEMKEDVDLDEATDAHYLLNELDTMIDKLERKGLSVQELSNFKKKLSKVLSTNESRRVRGKRLKESYTMDVDDWNESQEEDTEFFNSLGLTVTPTGKKYPNPIATITGPDEAWEEYADIVGVSLSEMEDDGMIMRESRRVRGKRLKESYDDSVSEADIGYIIGSLQEIVEDMRNRGINNIPLQPNDYGIHTDYISFVGKGFLPITGESPFDDEEYYESKSYRGLQNFKKQSEGKAFYKTFKKMHKSLKEGKALTRQESIDLYKAANSALTQMSIELEHNPKFLKTFNESSTLLSADVNSLRESLARGKAPSKKTMRSLAKFSEALLNESVDYIDELLELYQDSSPSSNAGEILDDIADELGIDMGDPGDDLYSNISQEDAKRILDRYHEMDESKKVNEAYIIGITNDGEKKYYDGSNWVDSPADAKSYKDNADAMEDWNRATFKGNRAKMNKAGFRRAMIGTPKNESVNESEEDEKAYRKERYEKAKKDYEEKGEEGNNDVLSREEKMLIARARMNEAGDEDEELDDIEAPVEETPEDDFVGDDEGDLEADPSEFDGEDRPYSDEVSDDSVAGLTQEYSDLMSRIQSKKEELQMEIQSLDSIADPAPQEDIANDMEGDIVPDPSEEDIEDEPEEEESEEDSEADEDDITDDELEELKKHLKEMRSAKEGK